MINFIYNDTAFWITVMDTVGFIQQWRLFKFGCLDSFFYSFISSDLSKAKYDSYLKSHTKFRVQVILFESAGQLDIVDERLPHENIQKIYLFALSYRDCQQTSRNFILKLKLYDKKMQRVSLFSQPERQCANIQQDNNKFRSSFKWMSFLCA